MSIDEEAVTTGYDWLHMATSVVAVAVLTGLLMHLPAGSLRVWASLVAGAAAAGGAVLCSVRYGAGADGLKVDLLGETATVPWRRIAGVERGPSGVAVRIGRRHIRWSRRRPRADAVAARLEHGLQAYRQAQSRAVSPGQLGELLGLADGTAIQVALPRPEPLRRALAFICITGACWLVPVYWDAFGAVGLVLGVMLAVRLLRDHPTAVAVVADAGGLSLRRGTPSTQLDWADLRSVESLADARGKDIGWRVNYDGGWFALRRTQARAEELVRLCLTAVRLQREGLVLPSTEEAPDTALSRLTGDEASAEHGLSLSDEGQ